jgi:hypothetical protein
MSGLSLFTIEQALLDLLTAREEILADPDNPDQQAELQAVETALADYVRAEVKKCDGIHHYLSAAKQAVADARAEAKAMSDRARRIEGGVERLKALCVEVMAMAEVKRIDGTAGRYLLRKGNGGVAPLVVDGWDAERERWTVEQPVLPSAWQNATIIIPLWLWEYVLDGVPDGSELGKDLRGIKIVKREPANDRIREALAADEDIPGARLGERGEHLELK